MTAAERLVPVGDVHEFLGLRPDRVDGAGVNLRFVNLENGVPLVNRGRYVHRDDILRWFDVNITATGSGVLARLRDELADITHDPKRT